ncbi:metal ABC transporter ATP-binding protein [Enterovirga aerilata]|uniref:Metal ABC transporter ATP-binding protein n=1 Tax=Enterovirga aerilata TaxID=2730920 RepID=A0A849I682_9HYPH|nr:metal ABC transporter ATP-binding protein [Enterovirga sp. DB1703]NNM71547.1 metal ABC transporter ATP-binding protein [Enterovirga sp. DB1703]
MTSSAAGGTAPALTFRAASFGYGGRPAIQGVDGAVMRGEVLALVGPNGAGKSTLLKGIVGEAARLSGDVDLHGLRVRDLAYLPQQPEIDRSFPITAIEFAATGLWRRLGAFGRYRPEHRAEVADALARVGLAALEGSLIGALSGGQMQRLLFARTLLQDAPLILLDEPFTGIDAATEADLLGIVGLWREQGRTVVAALHDLAQVRAAFPRALLVAGRVIAWGDTAAVLTAGNLARANGRELAPPADPAADAALAALGAT